MSENAKKEMRSPIETGCPDGFQYMHPTMQKTLDNGSIMNTQDLAF